MEKQTMIKKLIDEYGLSIHSANSIYEAVKAFDKYEDLPPATKEDMQVICDLYGVMLEFNQNKRGKLMLTGIGNTYKASYLYTPETLAKRHMIKQCKQKQTYSAPHALLRPNASNNIKWEVLNHNTGEFLPYKKGM